MKTMHLMIALIFSQTCFAGNQTCNLANASLTVHYSSVRYGEHLTLWYSPKPTHSDDIFKDYKSISVPFQTNGIYQFRFEIKTSSAILLRKEKADHRTTPNAEHSYNILYGYTIRSGDQIKLDLSQMQPFNPLEAYGHLKYHFSGRGSVRMIAKSKIDSAGFTCLDTTSILTQGNNYNKLNFVTARIKEMLAFLKSYKSELTSEDYFQLEADIFYGEKLKELQTLVSQYNLQKNKPFSTSINEVMKNYEENSVLMKPIIPEKILMNCFAYPHYLLTEASLSLKLTQKPNIPPDSLYYFLKTKYKDMILDRLISSFFIQYNNVVKDFNKIYYDAIQVVKSPEDLEIINGYKNRVKGTTAFNFALPDTSGKLIHLSQFKGKTVFLDFWFTGCAACEEFYRDELHQVEAKYKSDTNIVFIAICVDKQKSQWLKSVYSNNYTSTSIINLYTNGEGINNDVIKFYNIHYFPQPMIISKEQKIYTLDAIRLRQKEFLTNTLEKLR